MDVHPEQGERKVGKARLPRVPAVYGNRVLAVENAGSNRTRQLSFARLGDFAFALSSRMTLLATTPRFH